MQLPSKNPQEYNAKDIFNIFSALYNDKFGHDYVVARFIGHEMHLIKEALIEHGGYKIACAAYNGVRANDRSVNIPYIMAGLRYYIPTTSAKIYWFIHMDGTVDMKKKWKRGEILGATWLPSATQHIQLKEISDDLRIWANEKEKQYVGTVTKKRRKSKPI
jgi:hypothetical protein